MEQILELLSIPGLRPDKIMKLLSHFFQRRVRTSLAKLSDHAGYCLANAWDLLKPLPSHQIVERLGQQRDALC